MAWLSLLFLFPHIIYSLPLQNSNDASPIVDLGYVKYRGTYDPQLDINGFFGIRYAQSPTGERRWRPPQPIEKELGHGNQSIIDATSRGPICTQGYPFWRGGSTTPVRPEGKEDCLVLDLIAPASWKNGSEKLPVMVQIHGGGYTLGDSGGNPGQPLLKHSHNAILYVSIQYRLGAYGFLYSPDLNASSSTNLGLQDQRHALLWVKHHISAFGGDPEKVTIVGGSAGGGSVTSQMIMYGGSEDEELLFRAAIAEYPWWQPYLTFPQLETQYKYLLTAAKCNDTACLRGLSEDALATAAQETYIRAYEKGEYGYGSFWYGPYVDGTVIRDLPSKEFERGNYRKVPLLTNRETFEGQSFSNRTEMSEEEEKGDLKRLLPQADEEFVDTVFSLYPRESYNSSYDRRVSWFGDVMIDCPSQFISSSLANDGVDAWKMIFNAGTQRHAATWPFLYNLTFGSGPADNATLASIMKDWFISFAIDLDPNSRSWSNYSKPEWPSYAESGSEVVEVNFTTVAVRGDPDEGERCEFFKDMEDVVQN